MPAVLIIGANGQIARIATRLFLAASNVSLSLYLRDARRLTAMWPDDRVKFVEGDARDAEALRMAMDGIDAVYANLSGDMPKQARAIVSAMTASGLSRLVFISSMGIYGEIPGNNYGSILKPYRESAATIEMSVLDYTIIRPAWLNDRDEVAYGTTRKGEPFKNADKTVSRRSVAELVKNLVLETGMETRQSLGVHHP